MKKIGQFLQKRPIFVYKTKIMLKDYKKVQRHNYSFLLKYNHYEGIRNVWEIVSTHNKVQK